MIFASDIDGTLLLPSTGISPVSPGVPAAAAEWMRVSGNSPLNKTVALCTGRAMDDLLRAAGKLGIQDCWGISNGGARVASIEGGKIAFSKEFGYSVGALAQLLSVLKGNPGRVLFRTFEDEGVNLEVNGIGDGGNLTLWNPVVGVSEGYIASRTVSDVFVQSENRYTLGTAGHGFNYDGYMWQEYSNPTVSKGRALLDLVGVDSNGKTNAFALGDAENDCSMLATVRDPYVMGNASIEMKIWAETNGIPIIGTVEQGGAGQILYRQAALLEQGSLQMN